MEVKDFTIPGQLSEQYSREVFYNRLTYMVTQFQEMEKSGLWTYEKTPNPNAGQKVYTKGMDFEEILRIAAGPSAGRTYNFGGWKEAPEFNIKYGFKVDPKTLPVNYNAIRNIHDIVRDATALQMGWSHSADGLFPKLRAGMPVVMDASSAELIKSAPFIKSQIQANLLNENIRANKESLKQHLTEAGYKQVNYLDDMLVDMMNPEHVSSFIRSDLYTNPSDVGIFSKRKMEEPADGFYEQDKFAQANEALFHYNEGASSETPVWNARLSSDEAAFKDYLQKAGLSNEDLQYFGQSGWAKEIQEKYTDDEIARILNNAEDAGGSNRIEFRDLVVDLREGINKYEYAVQNDRDQMRMVRSILEEAESSKSTIQSILQSEQYHSTKLSNYVLGFMESSGTANDSYARHMMRLFLQSSEQMSAVPVTMPGSVTGSSKTMIAKINSIISDSYNPNSTRFPQYQRFRQMKSEYFNMYRQLKEAGEWAKAEGFLYVGERGEQKIHGFDADEYSNMYRESVRLARIQEQNAQAFERHKAALEKFEDEGKARPLQPANRFRGRFAEILTEENQAMAELEGKAMQDMIEAADRRLAESKNEIVKLEAEREKRTPLLERYEKELESLMQQVTDEADPELEEKITAARKHVADGFEYMRRIDADVAGHQAIINNGGWQAGGTDWTTAKGLNQLREALYKDGSTVTYLQSESLDADNRDRWYAALDANERIRLAGSEVSYQISGIQDNYVTLQKEVEPVSNATIRIDIQSPEELDQVIAKVNERTARSKVDQEVIREMNDRVITNAFINVRYDQKMVSEELKEKNPYLFEKVTKAETTLQEKGLVEYGIKEVNIPARDIDHVYTHFRKNLSELDQQGLQKRMGMTNFLLQMVESHAPWMMDDTSAMISSAELALREVTDQMAQGNQTIDLTDGALIKQWEQYAEVDDIGELTPKAKVELEHYSTSLAKKGIDERLNDHLFMRVVAQVVQKNFEMDPTNDSISRFVMNAAQAIDVTPGRRGVENDVYHLIHDPSLNNLYREHGYYAQAKQLSREQIREIINKPISNDVSLSMFENFDFDEKPDTGWDFATDFFAGKDYDGGMMQAHGSYNGQESMFGMQDALLGAAEGSDTITAAMIEEAADKRSQKNVLSEAEAIYKNMQEQDKLDALQTFREGKSFSSVRDVEFMLDMAKEMGQESVGGTVRGQEATIYRGNKGDVLAYLKEDNLTVQLTNQLAGTSLQVHVNDDAPQKFYGEAMIKEDIGDGGKPTRHQLTSYELLQGSGNYTIPTNPSVSIGAMQDFLSGKGSMTYLDIETTGLEGSTIDSKYIQPIEVFMQKVQWDQEAKQLRTNADGEYVVRRGGQESVREMQLMLSLTDDSKAFMKDLIDNEDFFIRVMGQEGTDDAIYMNAIDYEQNPSLWNSIIEEQADAPRIRSEITQKSDRLWYLRNIAKYAFPGEDLTQEQALRYNQYAGNISLPTQAEANSFIAQLKQDAQLAADLLDTVGKSGGAKYSNVQVGTTSEGMVKHVSRFVGRSPVAGQNVAKADWSKFMKAADQLVDGAAVDLQQTKLQLIPNIQEAKRDNFISILNDLQDFSVRQLSPEDNNRTISRRRKDVQSVLSKIAKDDWGKFASTDDFLTRLDQLASRKSEAITVLDTIRQSGKTVERIANAQSLDSVESWLNGSAEKPAVWGDGLEQLIDMEASAGKIQDIHAAEAELARVIPIRDALPQPKIVEQMYLSQLVNPNLSGNSAAAQFEQMGMRVESQSGTGLHLARNDVKNNLRLIEAYGRELNSNAEFMQFDNTPLQSGDFIEMYRQVDKESPLGVYQVDEINEKQMRLAHLAPDGTRTPVTIYGASQADLSRKVTNHFSFIGKSNVKKPVQQTMTRLVEDHARRQMARASEGAFTFDLYQGEIGEINKTGDLTNASVKRMQRAYEGTKRIVQADESFNPTTTISRVAAQNAELFEGNAVLDLLDKTATPLKKEALALTEQWMNSGEGQRRQAFLDEVRSLESTGAIDKRQSRSLIKEWNNAIKEKGFEMGAKHTVFNKSNLGTLDESFGHLEGTDFVIDKSDPSRVTASLLSMAERTKGLVAEKIDETKAKGDALNKIVLPFLEKQGVIQSYDPRTPPSVNSVVKQIMDNQNLTPYEEYDYLKASELSQDESFLKFMDDKSAELLQPVRDELTAVQESLINVQNDMRQELKDKGYYHPTLDIRPSLDDVAIDTFNFARHGGIGTYQTDELARLMDVLDRTEDAETRNTIAGELFQRATGQNQRVDVDDIIRAGDSDQLRAMEALNWVTNVDGTYAANPDIASHYLGVPGRDAGTRIGMVDLRTLDSIAGGMDAKYTKGNGYTSVMNKIQGWKATNYEGRYPSAPDTVRYKKQDTTVRENARASNEQTKSKTVNNPRTQIEAGVDIPEVNRHIIQPITPPDTSYHHSNVISDTITDVKDTVKNWATTLDDMGAGKAAKWIGGIGIAAFALSQFAKASSPIKLERREQGHGVEGATGQRNDGISYGDEGDSPSSPKPKTGGTAYVSAGEGGGSPKGYRVKVRGDAGAGFNPDEFNKKVNENIGSFNMNMSDNRTTLDRKWLEDQFSSYIDRGYVE